MSTLKNRIRCCILCGMGFFLYIVSLYADEFRLEGAGYASSSFAIDNRASVMDYGYHWKESTAGKWRLKDLAFDFCENIRIPGMPDTRETDFLNRYIFSVSQCPQGICLTDEYILITSYSTEDDCMGELMVFDRASGDYLVTLGMDEESHLGGVAFDGINVWVCNSFGHSIERISYDFVALMARENVGEVVDARAVVDSYPVKNQPSCICCYDGRLWVATHTVLKNSRMTAYHYDDAKEKLEKLSSYKIPSKVQGVAFDSAGHVYLSTSYGRHSSSYLLRYSSVVSLGTRPGKPELTVEMPPCSEELDCDGDTLYLLFESAGEKYLEGTDGKGMSLSPIDKLLTIPISEMDSRSS